ncbi:Zinc finger CCHC-type [Trinorchestia longiramus]|nr:Zinc finger CCHC-type [Trinorchestia longiramus]
MVCKEEVCLWFKKNEPHRRLELLCCLLNLCLPFELHFIKTCLEDLNKRVDLKEVEAKSNSHQEIESLCSNTLNENVRSKLVICLAFLGASNRTGSDVIYRFLLTSTPSASYQDINYLKDMLLLYTMVLNHPAFTFQQKNSVGNLFESLRKLANENDGTPDLKEEGEQAELKLQPSSDDECGTLQSAPSAAAAPELSTAMDAVQPTGPRPTECPPLARVPAHLQYFEGMPREYMEHLSQLTGALPYLPHPLHAVPGQQQSSQHAAAAAATGDAVPPEASASLNSYSPSHHFPSLVLDYAAVAAANSYYAPTALHPQQYAITDAVASPPPPPAAPSIPAEDAAKGGAVYVGAEVQPHEPSNHMQPVAPHQLLGGAPVYREYADPGTVPLAPERPVAIVALPHQPNNIDHNARRKNPESEEEFMYGDDVSVSTTYIYNSNIVAPLAHPSTMSLASYVGSRSNEGGCLLPCPTDGDEPEGGFGNGSGIPCLHPHTSSAHSSAQSSSPYASPPQSLPTSRCQSPNPEQRHHDGPGPLNGPSSRACLSPQDSEIIANNLACFAYQQSQNLSSHSSDPQQESLGGPHYINNDNTMNECSLFRSESSVMQPYPVSPESHVVKCSLSNSAPLCANGSPAAPCISSSSSLTPVECRQGVESGNCSSIQKQTSDGSHHQKERDVTKSHVHSASVNLTTTVTATVTTVVAHSSLAAQSSPSRKHAYRGRQAVDSEVRNDRQSTVASPSKQDKAHSHSKARSSFDSNNSLGSDMKRPDACRTSIENISFDVLGSSCSSQLHFMSHGDVPLSGSSKCASAQYPCECHQPTSHSGQADDALCVVLPPFGAGSSDTLSQCSVNNENSLAHDNNKSSRSQRRPSCDNRVTQSPQRHQNRTSQYTKVNNAGQGRGSPSKPTTAPPHHNHKPPPAHDCAREEEAYQASSAAVVQAGIMNCVEPSRLGPSSGSGRKDRNFAGKSNFQHDDPRGAPPPTSLHTGHPTPAPLPTAPAPLVPTSHPVPTSTSHSTCLMSHAGSFPPPTLMSQSTSQMPPTSGVTFSPVSSSSPSAGPPPPTSGPPSSHNTSASQSSVTSLPTALSSAPVRSSISSSTLSSIISSPGVISSRCTPSSSVSLVTSVPSSSSSSGGCISFGDVNLSSLDLPGPNEVVELSSGTDYLLTKPQFESQNRSSVDCVTKHAVNLADKNGSSSNSDAKYSCQKPDNRDGDPYRPLRILTNNSRGKPVSSRNNNSSSISTNGSSNHNSSHNNSNHNSKYRGFVPNSYDDSNASSFRSISGLNSRNAKRGVDCPNGGMTHMMSPPVRLNPEGAPPGNEVLSSVRTSVSSNLHNGDGSDQRPALLPCPGRGGNAPFTNGCLPSSSSAPEMPLPPPDDPSSLYVGRPCILPAPQHLISRAPHFGPNFLSTPPPSLPFQPGVGLLPAPPPPPPSKIPPMAMSSSPPPLTTSPSKTSTMTTASTTIVTSSSVSCHHRTSPPHHRTSPPHHRNSPPRAMQRASDQHAPPPPPAGSSVAVRPHGCNNGPPPGPPYGGPPYMQYPHMGGPHPYFMGGPRPPHSVFPPHKLPPPSYHGPPRQGNGGMGGGNSSSSSTCSSHSSNGQHKSRHSNRKSTHNSGSGGRGGYWGHQSGGRRGLVPPTGGSTDTSPDSSQYSSPPQTPSPDQENKTVGKRSEEEPWDRSSFLLGKGGPQGGGNGGDSTPPLPQVPLLFPPPHGGSVRPRYLHYPLLQYHPSPPMWRYSFPPSRFPSSHLQQQQQQQQQTQPPHGEKNSRETTPALVHLPQPPSAGEGHPEGTNGPSVSPPGMTNGLPGPLGGASYTGPPSNYPMLVNATMMALHSLVPTHPHHAPPPHPTPNPAHSLSNGFPAPHPQPSLPPNFPSLPNMTNSSLHPELFFASYGHSPQHSPYIHPPLLPHISTQAPLIANVPTGAGGGPTFSAASAASNKKPSSCYNCGQLGHRGTECREASIEDMTKRTKVS